MVEGNEFQRRAARKKEYRTLQVIDPQLLVGTSRSRARPSSPQQELQTTRLSAHEPPHLPPAPVQQTPSVNMAPTPELTATSVQQLLATPNLNATPSAHPHPPPAPVQQTPPACLTAQKRPIPRASNRGSSTTTTQSPDPFSGELSPVASPQVSPAPKRPKNSRAAPKQGRVATEGTRKSSRKK